MLHLQRRHRLVRLRTLLPRLRDVSPLGTHGRRHFRRCRGLEHLPAQAGCEVNYWFLVEGRDEPARPSERASIFLAVALQASGDITQGRTFRNVLRYGSLTRRLRCFRNAYYDVSILSSGEPIIKTCVDEARRSQPPGSARTKAASRSQTGDSCSGRGVKNINALRQTAASKIDDREK